MASAQHKASRKRKATSEPSENLPKKTKAPRNASEYLNKTVAQLKELCIERNCVTYGSKADLIERMDTYDVSPVSVTKKSTSKPSLNTATIPTIPRLVYVFGEGENGEVGLGAENYDGKQPKGVKRPRINHFLDVKKVGVVQLCAGGMHTACLTKDNLIYTWGVNDGGALGRGTKEGKTIDIQDDKSDVSDSDSDLALNEDECTPHPLDSSLFPAGTKFVMVAASDSATFALTDDGFVYGWGSFRNNEGLLGFQHVVDSGDPHNPTTPEIKQLTPVLIQVPTEDRRKGWSFPPLKDIVDIKCGTNHVMALTKKGEAWTWGAGEQSQLGRRVIDRRATHSLIPHMLFGISVSKPKIVEIGCGDYHSFAIDTNGKFYSWGLNSSGQTGHPIPNSLEGSVVSFKPVKSMKNMRFSQVDGGAHHSIGLTEEGHVYVWGNVTNHQAGVELDDIPEEYVGDRDARGQPTYIQKPFRVEYGHDEKDEEDPEELICAGVSAGPDGAIVTGTNGKAYSWGFSINYNTGLGTSEDVAQATKIENSAVRDKKIVYADAGGQFGVLLAEA